MIDNFKSRVEGPIQQRMAEVKPSPVIGDEDSIHLTDWDEGYRGGLRAALRIIKEASHD